MEEMPQALKNAYDNLKKLMSQLSDIVKDTKQINTDMLEQKDSITRVDENINMLEKQLTQLLKSELLPRRDDNIVSSSVRIIREDIKNEGVPEAQAKIQSKIEELMSRINMILHPLEETATHLIKTQEEIKGLENQLGEKQERITNLEDGIETLRAENTQLSLKVVDQTTQINALNHELRTLDQERLELKENIETNKQALKELQTRLDRTQTTMERIIRENEKVKHLHSDFLKYSREGIDPALRLPSNLIIQGISEELPSLEKLFENLKRICEYDTALIRKFEASKAFRNTLTSEIYADVLGSVFSGIRDAEDSTYNAAKNVIDEEEVWIDDPKNQRYIHTEIFLPYTQSAKNLLKTRQETLINVVKYIIKTLADIRDNPVIKKILIRRTGIRMLNLKGCEIASTDLPHDLNSIDQNMDAILGTINTEIEEKKRDLNIQFFDIIRETAKQIIQSGSKMTKLAAYAILRITLNILRRSSQPASELKKLFSKTLVLI
ncbi:MAG: hypothetical protein ACFE7E_02020 [Candidatus Hodarchaeota archaeon]